MSRTRWSNVTRSGRLHYNEEQRKVAKAASALEYARRQGYPLIGSGYRWTMQGHDSMVFLADGRWYWNSQGLSGRAIDFIMAVEDRTLPEAILILNGVDLNAPMDAPTEVPNYDAPELPDVAKELAMPEKSKNMNRMFGYLTSNRGIDRTILRKMVEQGRIFQTETKLENGNTVYNVAFAGLDSAGVIHSLFRRGCSELSNYKREVRGSDKSYPFTIPASEYPETLYVFEGAIDALSHATVQKLMRMDWSRDVRIAMGGGNSVEPILRTIDENPSVRRIVLCLDADEAGRKMTAELITDLRKRVLVCKETNETFEVESVTPPFGKDWNDYLLMWRKTIVHHAEYNEDITVNIEVNEGDDPELLRLNTEPAKPELGRIHCFDSKTGEYQGTFACPSSRCLAAAADKVRRVMTVVLETPEQLEALQRSEKWREKHIAKIAQKEAAQKSGGMEL
jgi:hypothetical protein